MEIQGRDRAIDEDIEGEKMSGKRTIEKYIFNNGHKKGLRKSKFVTMIYISLIATFSTIPFIDMRYFIIKVTFPTADM